MADPSLLSIEDLTVAYPAPVGAVVKGVSLSVRRGEVLGLAGESGAGKSTIVSAVMGLIDPPGLIASGRIALEGQTIDPTDEPAIRALRGRRIGMVFQDPLTALNPVRTVGRQLIWAVERVTDLRGGEARDRAVRLLDDVGLPEPAAQLSRYPHQLSGGMRQRVVIASAMAGDPDLLIADEPTTALDVSVQAGILDLLRRLCRERSLGVLLITHDMGVMAQTADRLAVMRYGELLEEGPIAQVVGAPRHAYVKRLIAAVPPSDRRIDRFVGVEEGEAPRGPLQSAPRQEGRLLEAEDVRVVFPRRRRLFEGGPTEVVAVAGASLHVEAGESLGIVGESGSGKSTLARALIGLQPLGSGAVRWLGARGGSLPGMGMIFQDPFSSLDPRQTVGAALEEPMIVHRLGDAPARRATVRDLLERVGLDGDAALRHPHQFSGGQRQRICIARALVLRPSLLICDEPTSALDVSVQAQILNLLKDLQRDASLALVFISHDLSVVRQMCDRTLVMRAGEVVEAAPTERIFEAPAHDYTRHLLTQMPRFAA